MSNEKIKIAIIGVGNCAKSLVEGTQYYIQHPEDKIGLTFPDIGGYTVNNLEFVVGFDVDRRKIGKWLGDALRSKPNCAMNHVEKIDNTCVPESARCYAVPLFDGVAPHMLAYPEEVTFSPYDPEEVTPLTKDEIVRILKETEATVLVNYLPVGTEEGSRFWVDIALEAGLHFVNCIPTLIGTDETKQIEQRFIDAGLTIVGSDMRSIWGASRMSEVLQGAMLDAGLYITQHIQMNMAAGSTQGQENVRTGRSSNTDFANMKYASRLKNKHISKENVLKGQNTVRGQGIEGTTLFAGPSLVIEQKPGGQYIGTDQKIANFDIVAYGFAGARYELTARLAVQDSANSAGIVISAVRFCKVASEMGIVGFLRGSSAFTQKTPPVQLTSADALYECMALARKQLTKLTEPQLKENDPKAENLEYTEQFAETDYTSYRK